MSELFVLISETSLVSAADLYVLAKHLETPAADVARAYGLEPPAIVVFNTGAALPASATPVRFVDDTYDPGALAAHGWDPVRARPDLRVWAGRGSGLLIGQESLSEGASHEIAEALVNPRIDLWTDCPGRPGVWIPFEVCDAVQNAYDAGAGVQAANYVLPAFFDTRYADRAACAAFVAAGGKFDRLGTLLGPASIGPEGYMVFEKDGVRWMEDAEGAMNPESLPASKQHPLSRTQRLLRR